MTLEEVELYRQHLDPLELTRLRAQCQLVGHAWMAADTGTIGTDYCARCFLIESELDATAG